MRTNPATAIQSAETSGGSVHITWADGLVSDYPERWLRYECTCPGCGESRTGIRFVTPADVCGALASRRCLLDDTGHLIVEWGPREHTSRYDPGWLRRHSLDEHSRRLRIHTPATWGAELAESLPQVRFEDFEDDTGRRCDAFEAIRDHGLVHILDGPAERRIAERLARRIGPLEETNFGRVFDLEAIVDSQSIGATRHPATLHTDDCYRNMPTGIKVIHCIRDADPGTGYSLFADGFHLGALLRESRPDVFQRLCQSPITYHRRYEDAVIVASAPVFSLDADGRLRGIRFQDRSMAPLQAPPHEVDVIFDAIVALMTLIADPANQLKLRLRPGEAILFDNHRVLHGRTGFTGHRHLQLCSVNRDTFISEMRVLQRSLGRPGADLAIAGGAFA